MASTEQRSAPPRASHSIVCLELLQGIRRGEPAYTIVASIDGREGTFSRSWGKYGNRLDVQEMTDMITWVQRTLSNGIILRSGVQEQLPLE